MRVKAGLIALACTIVMALSWQGLAADFGFAGGLGLTRMDKELFITTSLYPNIAIGKLGVGLELTLNVSKDGIRKEDWQEWEKVLARSVRYVRWAQKGAPLYLQFGTLYQNYIGTGILVNNYSNRTADDVVAGTRRLGLAADVSFSIGGVEALVNDTLDPSLMVARAFVNPFSLAGADFLDRLSAGVTVATEKRDTEPFTALQGRAFDVMYPLTPALVVYAHQATLTDNTGVLGSGYGTGVQGRLGPLQYVAEARRLEKGFIVSPFSKGYEQFGTPVGTQATEGYLLGVTLDMLQGDLAIGVRQEFNAAAEEAPTVTGSLVTKGELMQLILGREAELAVDYTKKVVSDQGTNGYLKAQLKLGMVRGSFLTFDYDAVIAPDGSVRSRTSGGVMFNAF